jgi:dihydroneopterin aldolase
MLEIDLVLEADLSAASASDDLVDTIDYGPLVTMTERLVEGRSYTLLEGLAGALASGALEAAPKAAAVSVRIRKLAVPMDVSVDWAEVEIRRER